MARSIVPPHTNTVAAPPVSNPYSPPSEPDWIPATVPKEGQTVSYPSAGDAKTMAQVRTAIDDLDRQIVALFGRRMRYIEAAAMIKPGRDAVRDEWRINDVLGKVREQAEKVRFPSELAEGAYRVLVEGSVQHEFTKWDAIREGDRN